MTVREVFELAVAHQQAGRLKEAEKLYRQLLARFPTQPELLNNLAALSLQMEGFSNALTLARQALQHKPGFAEAHFVAGVAMTRLHDTSGAITALRAAIELRPDYVEAMTALAAALELDGEIENAIAIVRKAISLRPGFSEAHNNLGNLLRESGRDVEAADAYRTALALSPDDPEVLNNLGTLMESERKFDQAIVHFNLAIALRSNFAKAHFNLGNAYHKSGSVDDAIASYQHAVALQPDLAEAWINLGNAQCDSGRIDQARISYERALGAGVDGRLASTALYAMHYDPRNTPADLLAEHLNWSRRHTTSIIPRRQHRNDRSPDRRLKIGYVSADLGNHPVGRFMKPLLANHNATAVEVFVYSGTRKHDALTDELRTNSHHWKAVRHVNDDRFAALVEQDQIDILVDLTMHANDPRLLAFARKPAPVQMTYLAYPGTTGLAQMDYRLTDPYIDPPGQSDENFSERALRLPWTYWCYSAPPEAPQVALPPMLSAGYVTFGSANAPAKVSSVIFDAWIQILKCVPRSRLLMHSRAGSHRDGLKARLLVHNVDPSRIEFIGFVPADQYFSNYGRFDIALDTHPYAGGTTTCDALWMGVPVVTLAGATAISRGGCSILSNIGLGNLVTQRVEDYVNATCELARDSARLQDLRMTMRNRMDASPLMNAPQFARDVEAAYRTAWHTWIATGS